MTLPPFTFYLRKYKVLLFIPSSPVSWMFLDSPPPWFCPVPAMWLSHLHCYFLLGPIYLQISLKSALTTCRHGLKMYFKALLHACQVNSSIASRPLAVTRSVYSETSTAYRPSLYRLFKEFCGSRKVTHFNRVSIYLWWDSFPSHFTVMVYFFLVMFYPYLWSVLNQS